MSSPGIEPPEPTPVEPLAELPPVANDLANHSVHIGDLRRRVRKMEESRPHFVREVQRMIANGFAILNSNLEAKWKTLDKVDKDTTQQTVILHQIRAVVAVAIVLIPAIWAIYVHFVK
jgi:hypothetical protein